MKAATGPPLSSLMLLSWSLGHYLQASNRSKIVSDVVVCADKTPSLDHVQSGLSVCASLHLPSSERGNSGPREFLLTVTN